MACFKRTIEELETNAILWWPSHLQEEVASISAIPRLLETQDDFLSILSLSKNNPYSVFAILKTLKFPANLFLKHLCVLANYGGEPIQRLGRSFSPIFQNPDGTHSITFSWKSSEYTYTFQQLPLRGLGNKKLGIDGKGLAKSNQLTPLYRDLIVILMFGSVSTVNHEAGLSACEIGTLLGSPENLKTYIRQRYINVSRITGGATANSLGQLAQKEVVEFLQSSLDDSYKVVSNGRIVLGGYEKTGGMPFDIVVQRADKEVGIEVSFQVTSNSTIERKAGQAADRFNQMHSAGHNIAYVIDGAGNLQRKAAISTICRYSDCTVAYSSEEFQILSEWLEKSL